MGDAPQTHSESWSVNRAWSPRVPDIAFGVILVLQSVVVGSASYMPYCDSTNHLARWVSIERYFVDPGEAGDVQVLPRLSGYFALDLGGASLVHLLGPRLTLKLLAVLVASLPGIGLYALLRTSAPAARGWATVGLLLGLNRYFFMGFLHYQAGVGLTLIWLACYERAVVRIRSTATALLSIFAVLVSQVHLSTTALLALFVAGDAMVAFRETSRSRGVRSGLPGVLRPAFLIGPSLAVSLLTSSGEKGSTAARAFELRAPLQKLVQVTAPFYTLSRLQAAVMASGYLLSLGTFLIFTCRPGRWNRRLFSMGALAACYAFFPVSIHGTYDVDVRFLLPMYLVLFIARTPTAGASGCRGLAIPVAACLVHLGVVFHETRVVDAELRNYEGVIRAIGAHSPVYTVIIEPPHFGVPIFKHFSLWHRIDKKGYVSGMFAGPGTPYMQHFQLCGPGRYGPNLDWQFRGFRSLDLRRLARHYRYILVVGDDPSFLRAIEAQASLMRRTSKFSLFELQPTGPEDRSELSELKSLSNRPENRGSYKEMLPW